jgi:dihydrofolate reductase
MEEHGSTVAPIISAIVALGARTRVIGHENDQPWYIPDDLKRFKQLTIGHPIIMGRKTFEAIGRVLPDRTNIVLTRDWDFSHKDVVVAHSLEEAFENARPIADGEVFVIGGGQIFEATLPQTDRLYLTLIKDDTPGDIVFPDYERLFPVIDSDEVREHNGLKYRWQTRIRDIKAEK